MSSYPKEDRRYQELSRKASEVTYAHDLGGNFTFLNQAGEQISGYSCEEACRMNIAQVVAPEIAEHVREQIMRNVTKRVGSVYEIEIIAKDGRRVPLEVSTRVVVRDGRPVEIEGIAVPSVLCNVPPPVVGMRCVDADLFFVS